MDSATILITGLGLAVAAGLNAYIPLMVAGLLVRFDVISFGDPYDILGSTPALVIVGILLAVELLADKIPAVDSVNDAIQTFIRPASGAVLFAAAAAGAEWQWAQALAVILGLLTALVVTNTVVTGTALVLDARVAALAAAAVALALRAPYLVVVLVGALAAAGVRLFL